MSMSNDKSVTLSQFDEWLEDGSDFAAVAMRQFLVPVEGKDAVIFPPTYPIDDNKAGYNIDRFSDGTNVCQIDSVGSQANRMEPIFKRKAYRVLVPQVFVTADDQEIALLDAGHRAADAIVRFSTLGPEIHQAYLAYREQGDAEPLARIAPTSIVFGSWDSRATQVKLPRIVRSVIRAYNVEELTRSAQYSTIAGQILTDGDAETKTEGSEAELGLAHVPAVKTHGGVRLRPDSGEIRRDGIVNLAGLRSLAAPSEAETTAVRRYILGLALISLTAPMEPNLREGCELVGDLDSESSWSLVSHDGTRVDVPISHEQATSFAKAASGAFNVPSDQIRGEFDREVARWVMALEKPARKKLLSDGPVTRKALFEAGAPEKFYQKLKAGDLKERCQGLGLPTEGKKDELVKRLVEAANA